MISAIIRELTRQPGDFAVIDGGHYGLEHIFIQHMAEVLREKLKGEAALVLAEPAWPSVLL